MQRGKRTSVPEPAQAPARTRADRVARAFAEHYEVLTAADRIGQSKRGMFGQPANVCSRPRLKTQT
jgi:hypothetical protein